MGSAGSPGFLEGNCSSNKLKDQKHTNNMNFTLSGGWKAVVACKMLTRGGDFYNSKLQSQYRGHIDLDAHLLDKYVPSVNVM
jgi:hypothetical protein